MPLKGLQDWQPMEAEVLLQHTLSRHAPEVQAVFRMQALPGGSEAGWGGVGLGVGVGEGLGLGLPLLVGLGLGV